MKDAFGPAYGIQERDVDVSDYGPSREEIWPSRLKFPDRNLRHSLMLERGKVPVTRQKVGLGVVGDQACEKKERTIVRFV